MGAPLAFTIVLPFLFAVTALAVGVTGALSLHGDCNELLDMTISASEVQEGRCRSLGFVYYAGECTYSGNCEPLPNEEEAYIVVSHVDTPSLVYYEGYQQVGSHFKLSAPEESDETLPEVYNVTVYSGKDNISPEGMIQTLSVQAPCDHTLPLTSGPVQFVFIARDPPTRRWQVEFSSQSSAECWSVESMCTAGGVSAVPVQDVSLPRHGDTVQVPLEVSTGLEVQGFRVTAHLVSTTGQHCIIEREWTDGATSAV